MRNVGRAARALAYPWLGCLGAHGAPYGEDTRRGDRKPRGLYRHKPLINTQFLFQVMDILAAGGERAVVHNLLLQRDIGFNAVDDDFA